MLMWPQIQMCGRPSGNWPSNWLNLKYQYAQLLGAGKLARMVNLKGWMILFRTKELKNSEQSSPKPSYLVRKRVMPMAKRKANSLALMQWRGRLQRITEISLHSTMKCFAGIGTRLNHRESGPLNPRSE